MGYNKAAGDQVPASEFNSFLASAGLYGASSAGSDAYAITVTPIPNDYDSGDKYTFKADVANTGACTLNVNSLGAKTIKKFGTLDLETGDIAAGQIVTVWYDGTYFQMISAARPTPFFQQSMPLPGVTIDGVGSACGSSSDGSVIWCVQNQTDLSRYQRDSLTGAYLLTHTITMSAFTISTNDYGSIINIGSYIYVFNPTANITCQRFLAADLTGQTGMTVPAVGATNTVVAWTNGTDAYLVSDSSNTTSRKWTVSGTTFTASATYTVTASIFDRTNGSTFWDGTNAFYVSKSTSTITIIKLTAIDGTTYTTTTKILYDWGQNQTGTVCATIDATRMYIGSYSDDFNATVVTAAMINLIPITKP